MPDGTPFDGLKELSLDTLGNGAAGELVSYELEKIAANIADPNTDPEAKRKLLIEVVFVPMKDNRDVLGQSVTVTSKLAGLKPIAATTYLVEKNGKVGMIGRDVRQVDAFEPPVDPSIRPINTHAKG